MRELVDRLKYCNQNESQETKVAIQLEPELILYLLTMTSLLNPTRNPKLTQDYDCPIT